MMTHLLSLLACYGVIGRAFPGIEDDEPLDQYKKIVSDLSRGIDDRREIMTFNHPNLIHISSSPFLCGLSNHAWFLLALAFQVLQPNALN
jgi:thymidylate synthase